MDILNNNKVVIEEQAKEQAEYKLLGSVRLTIDGGTIFEYNHETNEMLLAEFQPVEEIDLNGGTNRRISTNKKCTYIEALNKKNAWKRLSKNKILFTTN